jgi:glycosyltransferase involved in cell wall biosynthesis
MKKQQRILQIITLFSIGGATETVVALSKGLVDNGYDVEIVTGPHIPAEGDMIPIAERAGLRVRLIPELGRSIHPFNDLKALRSLMSIIREGEFDLIHTHSSKAGFLGRLAGFLTGVNSRVHTIHGLSFHSHQSWILKNMFVTLERFAARFTSILIAVSDHIRKEYERNEIGNKEQYVIVRSGFDTSIYRSDMQPSQDLRRKYNIGAEDIIAGKVSRISPLKGHLDLLQAFPLLAREFPRLKLLFVGDGELKHEIISEVERLGLQDKVIFTGTVDPAEIPRLLSLMHLVVHTSYHEGGPRVLPQALLMGKPVISFDTGLASEIIQTGLNGVVIPRRDVSALVEGFRDILAHYDRYVENCLKGIEDVEKEFDERKMVNDVCKIYEKLLD